MKKILAILLSGLMILGLVACGNSQNGSIASNSTVYPTAEEVTSPTENSDNSKTDEKAVGTGTTGSGNKILVVYYSASGHTKRVANDIANALNADTFELVPQTPYTDEDLDWTTDGSRVNKEHDDESLRDIPLVQDTVENWNEYSTIIIGA